jgi:hypothetical protein
MRDMTASKQVGMGAMTGNRLNQQRQNCTQLNIRQLVPALFQLQQVRNIPLNHFTSQYRRVQHPNPSHMLRTLHSSQPDIAQIGVRE